MLKDDLQTKEHIELFRRVFSTEDGQDVLSLILVLGGFHNDDIRDEQTQGKRNLCTTILKFMGVSQMERSNEYVKAFTKAMSNLTIEHKEERHD